MWAPVKPKTSYSSYRKVSVKKLLQNLCLFIWCSSILYMYDVWKLVYVHVFVCLFPYEPFIARKYIRHTYDILDTYRRTITNDRKKNQCLIEYTLKEYSKE